MKAPRSIFPLFVSVLAAGTMQISAQQSAEPSPKPPYVAAVPSYCHWTVVIKPEAASIAGNPKAPSLRVPNTIETVKTGDRKHISVSYNDGTSEQFDEVGAYFLTHTATHAQIFVLNSGMLPYLLYTEGFLFFDAINPSWFKSVTKLGSVNCFYYQNGATELWVDTDTMLPVAAKSQGMTAYFQFQQAPSSPIVLPADEQAVLDHELKAYKAFQAMH